MITIEFQLVSYIPALLLYCISISTQALHSLLVKISAVQIMSAVQSQITVLSASSARDRRKLPGCSSQHSGVYGVSWKSGCQYRPSPHNVNDHRSQASWKLPDRSLSIYNTLKDEGVPAFTVETVAVVDLRCQDGDI